MTRAVIPTPPIRLLEGALKGLVDSVQGLRILVLGDSNGLPVMSIPNGSDTVAATAMATMLLSAASTVAVNMGLSERRRIWIEGDGWTLIVHPLEHGFSLLGLFEPGTNQGLAKLELNRRVPEIAGLLARMC